MLIVLFLGILDFMVIHMLTHTNDLMFCNKAVFTMRQVLGFVNDRAI